MAGTTFATCIAHQQQWNEEQMPTKKKNVTREKTRQRSYAKPPIPKQHQESPGLESVMHPRPKFEAPLYKPAGKLMGKVALVTGGDSGIGRAVSVMFAREGADVAIVYLPDEQSDAEETQQTIHAEGRRAILLPGTVTSSEFCQAAVAETVKQLGGLDILVNNAAFQKNQETIDDVSEEQFDKTFKTNIYGYFFMAKAALQYLKAGGCIINTGSITGLEGEKTLLDYAATKGAIHAFTKSLAQNLVERKIRVNAVAPGPVWTPLNTAAKPAEEVTEFGSDAPMGRPGEPEELAPTYVFLASNADSSFMSGEVIAVLGGDVTAG
jgi:NAD(P)-dependent dehydrogenase (short-subunit alcohol dehydrogenase family)